MTPQPEDFDLLVIGGGKAGKTLSMDRANAGQRVAMVERGMIGGTCINVACIPTKALVASARALRTAQRAEELGVIAEQAHIDVDLLRAHKEGVVDGMVASNHKQFLDSGMDLVIGEAHFTEPRTVAVALIDGGTRVLRGHDVVINTGTRPLVPPIPGLAESDVRTSNSLLGLERLPQRLIVLGGGSVGVEFAQMFATFGSAVTVLEGAPQLLGQEDPDVAQAVVDLLTSDGIEVRVGVKATRVTRNADTTVTVTLEDDSTMTADDLIAAVGRAPVTDELNADAAGVEVDDRGFVVVDEHLRTSSPHIWAAGDVAGSPQFTHASLDDYRILKANIAGEARSTAGRLIPYTVFVTPELARVGLSETQARQAGYEVRVARLPVSSIPRARTLRQTTGIWKAVVDATSDRILGAALLSAEAGEVITTIQMAMLAGMPYTTVRDAIITHPTMTEGLNLLFAHVEDEV